jgi:predicted ATP-grasp superfamily ATP-dependent carboligase
MKGMKKIALSRLLPPSKPGIIAGSALLIGAAATIAYVSLRPKAAPPAPTYDVVLPQRTSVTDLGGWQRVSPEGKDPVFAYNDEIDSVRIIVSQQAIPSSFEGNVAAQVKQLADSYSATTVIEAGGTDVYIGRSARGPQSVIFAKNNTLVLIKSEKTISQSDWVRYINNLVDPKSEQLPTF